MVISIVKSFFEGLWYTDAVVTVADVGVAGFFLLFFLNCGPLAHHALRVAVKLLRIVLFIVRTRFLLWNILSQTFLGYSWSWAHKGTCQRHAFEIRFVVVFWLFFIRGNLLDYFGLMALPDFLWAPFLHVIARIKNPMLISFLCFDGFLESFALLSHLFFLLLQFYPFLLIEVGFLLGSSLPLNILYNLARLKGW